MDAPATPVWKMIYLARRNPALAAEAYPQAWREHSALGRQCRNVGQRVRSVAQCSRVLGAELPGTRQDYDGVNLMVLADRESASAIWNDPETLAIMKPDEPRVFDRYVRECALVAAEQVLRDAPRTPVLLCGFLRRRAGLDGAAFGQAWQALAHAGACSPLLAGPLGQATRVVLNEVVDTPPAGYEYDLIVEWWFESVEALRQALATAPGGPGAALAAPLAGLLDLPGSVFMLTQVTHSRP